MFAAIYKLIKRYLGWLSCVFIFDKTLQHRGVRCQAPYGLISDSESSRHDEYNDASLCVEQNAVSHHNMSYWQGRQYIGVGPGEPLNLPSCRWNVVSQTVWVKHSTVVVTGAHGRFALPGDGGVVREARTQTLEPDVWIREVRQRGHGTRRRTPLSHLELWDVALTVQYRQQCCVLAHVTMFRSIHHMQREKQHRRPFVLWDVLSLWNAFVAFSSI